MKLIAGLGNPGRKYVGTPHNVGYQAADRLAERIGIRLRASKKVPALVGQGKLAGEETLVVKPTTFMNLSGEAVAPLAFERRLSDQDVLVLVDDADLPLGALRLRMKGGHGGHKGLRSLIRELESDGFARLRIGICPLEKPRDLEAYVLTRFGVREALWMEEIVRVAVQAVEMAVRQGLEPAANRFNGLRIPDPSEPKAKSE